jgi:hypothetical protein
MMPSNRFSLPGDDDRRLLDNCDMLEITMYKDEEGDVTAHFKLCGCIGRSKEDDEGPFAPEADMGFVRDLIAKFEKVKD